MLHELSAAPSPLKIRIVCIPEEIRQIYFSTSVFISERKKNWRKKKCFRAPSSLTPPSVFSHGWSFQTIGCVHRGINGFCKASQPVEGMEPSSEWGTAGLPLLVTAWVFECVFVRICAIVAADLCAGSEVFLLRNNTKFMLPLFCIADKCQSVLSIGLFKYYGFATWVFVYTLQLPCNYPSSLCVFHYWENFLLFCGDQFAVVLSAKGNCDGAMHTVWVCAGGFLQLLWVFVWWLVMIGGKNNLAISRDCIVMFILLVSPSHGSFVYRIATACACCSCCKNGSALI